MHRLKFTTGVVLVLLSTWCRRSGVGPHRSISLAGHHSHPRQGEIHDTDRATIDREDHGSGHRG